MSSNLITRSIFLFCFVTVSSSKVAAVDTIYRWSKRVDESRVEELEARLADAGVAYVLEKHVKLARWQFLVYSDSHEVVAALPACFGGTVEIVDPATWLPSKQADELRKPQKIRDTLLIVDEEESEAIEKLASQHPGRIVLSFPPQLAFGTGSHGTTASCLRFLVDFAKKRENRPWRMLDLGTGSGILAIAAAKLGASEVIALENDAMALEYARANAERHGVQEAIEFIVCDVVPWLREHSESACDLITANLFHDLLIELLPILPSHLAPNGELILSGFLRTQAESMLQSVHRSKLNCLATLRRGKWMAARCGG